MKKVKVKWFDQVHGIGEGETDEIKGIFLKWENIQQNGRFLTLQDNEIVECEIQFIENNAVATKIVRENRLTQTKTTEKPVITGKFSCSMTKPLRFKK